MGSKPKKQEYRASETEKTQAAIAAADQRYFEDTYDPLLVEMRDKAATEDVASTLRGRAGADFAQALSPEGGAEGYSMATDIGSAANLAIGATGQMLSANRAAKDAKVTQQVGVLGTARGQAADAGDALAQASKLARSEGLAQASAKQQVRMAKQKAAFDVASAGAQKMMANVGDTGSPFRASTGYRYDPVSKQYQKGSVGILGSSPKWETLDENNPWIHSRKT